MNRSTKNNINKKKRSIKKVYKRNRSKLKIIKEKFLPSDNKQKLGSTLKTDLNKETNVIPMKQLKVKPLEDLQRTPINPSSIINNNITTTKTIWSCASCNKIFCSLVYFDCHVTKMHCTGSESLFFPEEKVFKSWLDDVQNMAKVKYEFEDSYNSRNIYRCVCISKPTDVRQKYIQCPSLIITQTFAKGVQVHFYSTHAGHFCQIYHLDNKYKRFSIPTIQNANRKENVLEPDLYLQFKSVMEYVVNEAAKLNVDTLKLLVSRAMEMTLVLTNYDEDYDIYESTDKAFNRHSLSDSETFANRHSSSIPVIPSSVTINQQHDDLINVDTNFTIPKIVQSFSLVDVKIKNEPEIKTEKDFEIESLIQQTSNSQIGNTTIMQIPCSFNDSYKEFVYNNEILDAKQPKFHPNTPLRKGNTNDVKRSKSNLLAPLTLSNRKGNPKTYANKHKLTAMADESQHNKHTKIIAKTADIPITNFEMGNHTLNASNNNLGSILKKALETKHSYDKLLNKPMNVKSSYRSQTKKNKKERIKTKIGQFKRILSPAKIADLTDSKTLQTDSPNATKIKVDKYEVMEQENDCNILILKI